jgi:hypothetical protein
MNVFFNTHIANTLALLKKGKQATKTAILTACRVSYAPFGTNFIDTEFTQCLVFFGVRYSPSKTWPRCALQLAQTISTRLPSASGMRFTAPGISSSKLGQPQCDSNFDSDVYKGVSHLLHTYKPCALLSNSAPVNGRSVPLYNITLSSSGVRGLYSIV